MTPLLSAILVVVVLGTALIAARRPFGFRAQRSEDHRGSRPRFDPRQHLSGPILCEGVIYGPTGRITLRFVARPKVWGRRWPCRARGPI